MKALVWHGKEDIRYDTVSDPEIEHPRDAIIKVTSCAICGSDLHLFHNFIPAMMPGDIMGHEMMGEVVEVGSGVNGKLKKGDRIVVPFTIWCGECEQCKRGNYSVCERTNRKKEIARQGRLVTLRPACSATRILPAGIRAARPNICGFRSPIRHTSRFPTASLMSRCCSWATSFPTGWQACRPVRHPADGHRRHLGLRARGADGDPERRPSRRQTGGRHRSPAGASQPWLKRVARPRSISRKTASSTGSMS